MGDGPGIDVLEGGLQAEEEPKDSAVMRQVWRAEAERAAEYFSGLPGFGPATPDVRLTQVVQPASQCNVAWSNVRERGRQRPPVRSLKRPGG